MGLFTDPPVTLLYRTNSEFRALFLERFFRLRTVEFPIPKEVMLGQNTGKTPVAAYVSRL